MKRTRREIAVNLREHLANGGTLNDDVTEELYREWNGDTEGRDTELELVEHWAIGVASSRCKTVG